MVANMLTMLTPPIFDTEHSSLFKIHFSVLSSKKSETIVCGWLELPHLIRNLKVKLMRNKTSPSPERKQRLWYSIIGLVRVEFLIINIALFGDCAQADMQRLCAVVSLH